MLAEHLPPGLLDNPWRYPITLQLLAIVARILAEQCADENGLTCNLAALWKVVQLINDIASAQATGEAQNGKQNPLLSVGLGNHINITNKRIKTHE